jgi:hypothetical protein
MKRRVFGLLAGTSLAALKCGAAKAQTGRDASLLSTTLTPFGAVRAGNADGSIPAWTGGYTTLPSGWQPGQYMPDFFADEPAVVTINAGNMAQHADKLSDGTMAMMTKYGYSIKVYPTHRTAGAPQWVYDNTAKNCTTAQLDPAGGRLGFSNAYGGVAFPIPDTSDPLAAGAQIIWNHEVRWQGQASAIVVQSWVINGGAPSLSAQTLESNIFPYYQQNGSLASYSGILNKQQGVIQGPPQLIGEAVASWYYSDPFKQGTQAWELLSGQGRVRRAPEFTFDTPSTFADGLVGYDEYQGFGASLEEYDWKFIEKKELYVPYNNNGLSGATPQEIFGPHFMNPDLVRWELHRVWVVEATLHPGKRNVLARRRFYVDEDNWTICATDAWDANGSLYHVHFTYNVVRPDVPGTIQISEVVHNMQNDNYVTPIGVFNQKAHPGLSYYDTLPEQRFDPQNMAAASQY